MTKTLDIIWSNRIYSLKYIRSTALNGKDIRIRHKSLWQKLNSFVCVQFPLQNRCFSFLFYRETPWSNSRLFIFLSFMCPTVVNMFKLQINLSFAFIPPPFPSIFLNVRVTRFAKMALLDSQRYPWNLYLTINAEDIVVFQGIKVCILY